MYEDIFNNHCFFGENTAYQILVNFANALIIFKDKEKSERGLSYFKSAREFMGPSLEIESGLGFYMKTKGSGNSGLGTENMTMN